MSQRNVELLIGRLLTDEEMRRRFMREAAAAPSKISAAQGWELSLGEIEALAATRRDDVVGARVAHPVEAAAVQPQDGIDRLDA